MARFEHLIFVCTKERPSGAKNGSCQARGGAQLLEQLRELVREHGLKGRVRVTSSGCLDLCAKGCVALAYRAPSVSPGDDPPNETWYTGLTVNDARPLFAAQVLQNSQYLPHVQPTRSIASTNRAVAATEAHPSTEEP